MVDDVNGALTRADVDVTGVVGEHGIRAQRARVVANAGLVRVNTARYTLLNLVSTLRLAEVVSTRAQTLLDAHVDVDETARVGATLTAAETLANWHLLQGIHVSQVQVCEHTRNKTK